jgi:uncharacterized repeat protein (TIGR03803 family)
MPKKLLPVLLLLTVCGATSVAAQAPVYTLLFSPSESQSVAFQPTTMFEVESGLFYVLSATEGNTHGASVFNITSTGTFHPVYSFQPYVNVFTLIEDTNGELYGPGASPQNSFYFSLRLSGKGLQEYPFAPRWSSGGGRTIVAPTGELYDLAGYVPTQGPETWAIDRIAKGGKITTLHQFSGSDGAPNPSANLVYGPDSNIYSIGNQIYGGVSPGFIYRITPSGAYSKLLDFPSFPQLANLPFIMASDGNLYGSFDGGGANNTGYIYQVTLSGQLTTVASFPATGMAKPETLMQAADGHIYGTTNNNHIFRYNLQTKELTSIYNLSQSGAQGGCPCQLTEGMDGKLYGVTPVGGNYPGLGAIFSLDIGLPPPIPAISQLKPASAPVGQQVMLWGRYLLGATSVTFNGVPTTTFSVTSEHSVWATVPPGATSGPVTITTANGSFTSTEDFTVQ